jgi:hypothetical protein
LPAAVRRALDVYARCASYRDEIDVTVSCSQGPGQGPPDVLRKRYTTSFVRARGPSQPGGLRFDHGGACNSGVADHPACRAVLWLEGDRACAWSDFLPVVERRTLSMAIAAAYGVSEGVSGLVIPALFPDTDASEDTWYHGGMRLEAMRDVGHEEFDGRACFRVDGEQPVDGAPVSLWFDAHTGLLAGWESRSAIGKRTRLHERIVIRGEINAAVPAEALTFVPPPVARGRAMRARLMSGALRMLCMPIAYVGAWFVTRRANRRKAARAA